MLPNLRAAALAVLAAAIAVPATASAQSNVTYETNQWSYCSPLAVFCKAKSEAEQNAGESVQEARLAGGVEIDSGAGGLAPVASTISGVAGASAARTYKVPAGPATIRVVVDVPEHRIILSRTGSGEGYVTLTKQVWGLPGCDGCSAGWPDQRSIKTPGRYVFESYYDLPAPGKVGVGMTMQAHGIVWDALRDVCTPDPVRQCVRAQPGAGTATAIAEVYVESMTIAPNR